VDSLPLDDPRWKELDHRNWRDGKPSEWSPSSPFVPIELAKLDENPGDIERFWELLPWLCSESTTYAAAYAAFPYFVDFARRLSSNKRTAYLIAIGLIVASACPEKGSASEIKPYLKEWYSRAIENALPLLLETLSESTASVDLRYLLASVAAVKGNTRLANVLQDLDAISCDCPKCGEVVFPTELQEAVE
jgi:hypothetical protein